MRVLIRELSRRGKGGVASREQQVDRVELRLGRGTDQDIQIPDLRVALEQAVLRRNQAGKFELAALGSAGFRLNDRHQQRSAVGVGDRIEIGRTCIDVVEPPDNADLALEVQQLEPVGDEPGLAKVPVRAVLPGRLISKRFWSWVLFAGILGLFLVLPVVGFFNPPIQELLRESPLPSDHAWSAGELARAHSHFEGDCQQCHQQPFVSVTDQACIACHADTPHHTAVRAPDRIGAESENCTSCHRDHNGPDGMIASDQRLCSHCHDGHALASAPIEGLGAAGDFGFEHPQFRVSLVDFHANGEAVQPPRIRRLPIDHPDAIERPTLKFPHDVHLDPRGLQSPMGDIVLECADCHRPEPGGLLMAPVSMEQHCQACHALELDPNYPQRAVPHGKPEEVLFVISEYFARLAVEGAYWERGQPAISFATTAEAREWAYRQALTAGARMFEDRACGTCHEVQRFDTDEGPRWEVRPVRFTRNWFPAARFDHDRHRSMDCTDCHAAETSSSSADVLMPGIETCRSCHAGEHSGAGRISNRIVSSCIDCHGFHTHPLPVVGSVLGIDTGVLRSRLEDAPEPDRPRRMRPGRP